MLQPSICRVCHQMCSIVVEVEDGRAVRVTGDDESAIYQGYTCVKGRALPEQLYHPERLLHSQERQPDGTYASIGSEALMDEVATRVQHIIDRHGPRSVAFYLGSGMVCAGASTGALARAFRVAIGSPMAFSSDTIDQPGKQVAKALHGSWMAPAQGFDHPDVALLVGSNPLVSHTGGLPYGNPGRWLKEWLDAGLFLAVVDPRRSDVARRAAVHLQPRPGEDVAILAGLVRVILSEGLHDVAFVDENVAGVERLHATVAPFTPEYVARRADIDAQDLVTVARRFAAGSRGYAVAATGPNMSGPGTLVEYLILSLNTLCGRWLRDGERVAAPLTLLPQSRPKAQAQPPVPGYGFGETLYGTGMRECSAGIPCAGLADDILSDAPDRVRALFSIGGNPVAAWPDQLKTLEAMDALELLVQVDIKMSATSKVAHYVVAPRMSLETATCTTLTDRLSSYAVGHLGSVAPWGQYTPAVVSPPEGSDLLEEWEFFYGLGQRMGLELSLGSEHSPIPIDMQNPPSSDDLLGMIAGFGRVPLDEVKKHPHGAIFDEPAVVVGPKDPGWTGKLEVGDAQMMADLAAVASEPFEEPIVIDGVTFDFRLVSRRQMQVYNSSGRALAPAQKRPYNPAFMHPADLERLGLQDGDLAEIRSQRAAIVGVAMSDPNLRPGLVSMSHAYGDAPAYDAELLAIGSPTSRLVTLGTHQPYTGQPQMSNVPVVVRPVTA